MSNRPTYVDKTISVFDLSSAELGCIFFPLREPEHRLECWIKGTAYVTSCIDFPVLMYAQLGTEWFPIHFLFSLIIESPFKSFLFSDFLGVIDHGLLAIHNLVQNK